MDDQNLPVATNYVFKLPPVAQSPEYAQQLTQENADREFVFSILAKIYSENVEVSESDHLQNDMQQLGFILERNGWRLNGQLLIESTNKNNHHIKDVTEAAVAAQIEAQKNPVTATGVPW